MRRDGNDLRAPESAWSTAALAMLGALAMLAPGCLNRGPSPGALRVPPDLLRGGEYGPGGEPPRSRYVVRMSDGQREWEMQLPEIATAYEVSVPLKGKPATGLSVDLAALTAADREILEQRRAEEGDGENSDEGAAGGGGPGGEEAGGAGPVGGPDGQGGTRKVSTRNAAGKGTQRNTPSYLLTLARVKELYRTRNNEVALIELVELERHYPNDERILSMKGTLHLKLGHRALAREAWNAVLGINPYNLAVLEALQRLDKKGE